MFGEDHHESINQRGIDEALACQDMLARAPSRPPLFMQVLARLAAAARVELSVTATGWKYLVPGGGSDEP